jgi:hypothetical protein
MSLFSNSFAKATSWIDPAGAAIGRNTGIQGYLTKKPGPPAPPQAPNVSTAANLTQQQDDLRNRQRGVLSNIFAGSNAPPPTTATSTVLGG